MRAPVPTRLYAVVQRGRDGKPRGFEKCADARFFHTIEDAEAHRAGLPSSILAAYMVAPFLAYFEGSP